LAVIAWRKGSPGLFLADPSTGEIQSTLTEAAGYALAYSPDGSVLAASDRDGGIDLWDPLTGRRLDRLEGHRRPVEQLAFSADGETLASGASDGTVLIWQPKCLSR
jgi:WD40 repeat protein